MGFSLPDLTATLNSTEEMDPDDRSRQRRENTERAERLRTIRNNLCISAAEMGGVIGVVAEDSAALVRDMESQRHEIPDAIDCVLRYMGKAFEIDRKASAGGFPYDLLPRWLECTDLEDLDPSHRVLMHTRWPRFFGVLLLEERQDRLAQFTHAGIPVYEFVEEGLWMVTLFIDEPVREPWPLIEEAARLMRRQWEHHVGGPE